MSTCRVCLRKVKNSISLEQLHKNVTYLEMLNECTQLHAHKQDNLPQCLCTPCRIELIGFYEFLQKAQQSDAQLKRTLWNLKSNNIELACDLEATYDEFNLPTSSLLKCENTKDPLETDDEQTFKKTPNLQIYQCSEVVAAAGLSTSDNANNDDDEDDKPLKHLLNKVKATKRQSFNVAAEALDFNLNFCDVTANAEEQVYDDYSSNKRDENMPDAALSAESQIFPQGRFKCEKCDKTYFTTVGLEAHIEVHVPKSATLKRKRVRGPNKKSRKANVTVCKAKKEAECNSPIETDLDAGALDSTKPAADLENEQVSVRKMRKPKPPKPKKLFPCHVCGKHMISASKLRYHMVMHTGEKDYLCSMCPKAYSTIYALKHHIRTHSGERPYECKFCGDRFLRPTTLKSHMRRHTGERPYGCDICGKRFIQHSSMTTHIKLNHMAKTIPCPHCDKKYARQTDLNTHLLSHTGDKPFACQSCPSRFIRQANLNKHMNQHHSGMRTNDTKSLHDSKRTADASITIANVSVAPQLTPLISDRNHRPMHNISTLEIEKNSDIQGNLQQTQNVIGINSVAQQHPVYVDTTHVGRLIQDLNHWN